MNAPTHPERSGIIDLHAHWFSPAVVDFLERRTFNPRILRGPDGTYALHRAGPGGVGVPFSLPSRWFDIEERLAHLDASGVAHQLISWPTTLNLDAAHDAADWRPLWQAYNDDLAALVRQHPSRFSAVAALSTQDIAWSVRELERAHERLGLIGAVLPVNAFFTTASARTLAPIFDVAQRYGSHIYLHTGYASPVVPGQPPLVDHADNATIRWIVDSAWHFASAVATLAFGPFLKPYPDITVQIAMLGGVGLGPLLVEQVAINAGRSGIGDALAGFRQLWFDTGATGSGAAAIGAAVRAIGADRIVFGSDYGPVAAIPPVIGNVEASGASETERDAIFHGNARKLLDRTALTHQILVSPPA